MQFAAPILGPTPHVEISRRLALAWGVQAILVDELHEVEQMIRCSNRIAVREKYVAAGGVVAIVAEPPFASPARRTCCTCRESREQRDAAETSRRRRQDLGQKRIRCSVRQMADPFDLQVLELKRHTGRHKSDQRTEGGTWLHAQTAAPANPWGSNGHAPKSGSDASIVVALAPEANAASLTARMRPGNAPALFAHEATLRAAQDRPASANESPSVSVVNSRSMVARCNAGHSATSSIRRTSMIIFTGVLLAQG